MIIMKIIITMALHQTLIHHPLTFAPDIPRAWGAHKYTPFCTKCPWHAWWYPSQMITWAGSQRECFQQRHTVWLIQAAREKENVRGILKKTSGGKKGRGSHRSFEKSQLVDKLQVDKQQTDKQLVAKHLTDKQHVDKQCLLDLWRAVL